MFQKRPSKKGRGDTQTPKLQFQQSNLPESLPANTEIKLVLTEAPLVNTGAALGLTPESF